jgi:hypothetical protein
MRAFIDVDVLECLRRVTEENTVHYRTDFEYDIHRLKAAALDGYQRDFLWMSRESGTYLFNHKHVFVKGVSEYNTWLYNRNHPEEIRAFFVHVDEIRDGKPRGYLAELDYTEHCRQVEQMAIPAAVVKIDFHDGQRRTFDYADYNKNWLSIFSKHGHSFRVEYDAPGLDDLMYHIHYRLKTELEPDDFEAYMKEIRLEPFERLGCRGNDFVRLGSFDARKCLEYGVPVYLFEQGAPAQPVRDFAEIDRFPYRHPQLLAIRNQEAPILSFLNPENKNKPQLFSYQELFTLQSCVAYAGKNFDATPGENETLRTLLGKLHLLTDGIERRDFVVEQGLELESAAEQEPEP